jgi:hypothetical protein
VLVPSPLIPLPQGEGSVFPSPQGKSAGFDDSTKTINYHQKGRG